MVVWASLIHNFTLVFQNGVYYRTKNRMPKLEIRNSKLDKGVYIPLFFPISNFKFQISQESSLFWLICIFFPSR